MTAEIKWFLYILKLNEIISDDDISAVIESLSSETDLDSFANDFFENRISSITDIEELEQLNDIISQAKTLAKENAVNNSLPPDSFNYLAAKPDKPIQNVQNFSTTPVQPSSPKTASTDYKATQGQFSNSALNSIESIPAYLRQVLTELKLSETSDFHISANCIPYIRKNLAVSRIGNAPTSSEQLDNLANAILSNEQKKLLEENKTVTFSLAFCRDERYRVTAFYQKDGLSFSFHIVSNKIRSLQELGFSEININAINFFLSHHNGLILVTGPIGSGKTTTLASIVDSLNQKRTDHILMIENPVEIVQISKSCNVTQREVLSHTQSYSSAIKASLREDPDIIVVGELNDLETIEIAIKASETGHLVIGTLQTSDASNTLNRLINTFPPFQQPQIKAMLSTSLRGIICQRLVPSVKDKTVMAVEILANTLAVANTIIEGKLHLIKSIMQTASKSGMISMDESVYDLFLKKLISKDTALLNISDKKHYGSLIEKSN